MLSLNGKIRHLALAIIDAVLVVVAFALGVYLRFDFMVPLLWFARLETLLLPATLINLAMFFLFGFYRRVWRYTSVDELLLIAVAVSAGIGGT
ncbi:MAG TPA: hypothetical protein VLH18_09000, partial [Candidatus Limnocylindrales bacterium]|nr:hypothetical protein [Candidatus Limnocylindrales bacterium]